MKDLGPLQHFLGISVERKSNGLFLAQKQYTLDIIQWAGMVDCKPCSTAVDTQGWRGCSNPISLALFIKAFRTSITIMKSIVDKGSPWRSPLRC
jgi:hypothetical protein